MSTLRVRVLFLAVLLLAVCASRTSAQTVSANLSGFVNDPTGAVVPGANIVLTNQASKDKRSAVSNSSGFFSFIAVPAGTYSVQVSQTGFGTFTEKNIELHPSDERTLTDIKLKIGIVETSITVNSAASAIDTTGEKSALITAEAIKRLPVEGRDDERAL